MEHRLLPVLDAALRKERNLMRDKYSIAQRNRVVEENLFARTMEGNPLIDKAYELVLAA